jgi:imidazolonepropionase-like amidohydrolase
MLDARRARALVSQAVFTLSLCACSAAPPPPAHDHGATTAFVGVTVIPMDRERLLPQQTVLVRADQIVAMGEAAAIEVPRGARVIDGRGKYLLPGLIEMHTHLTREEDLLLYVALGVTTVRNMWGTPLHLGWRERIERSSLIGPTIYTAGPIVDGDPPVHDGSLVVRSEAEAERAVRFHRQAGYDFLKIYSRLSAPVFEQLLKSARNEGLPVSGHVPRAVGLRRAIDAGMSSIEHLDAFSEALQAEGSPVGGRWDGPSRDRKIDFVDEAGIAPLVRQIHERGTFLCPTRNLLNQSAPISDILARFQRPEMRYVPGFDRAIWRPWREPSEEDAARNKREISFADTLIRALHQGKARLLLGTDAGNPLVIPGFTVHEELELLVRAGLTPYEALRTATLEAAELLRASAKVGTVAVGKRADLLLLEGNPLSDVSQSARIAGVMARGHFFGADVRAAFLARAEAFAQGKTDLFHGLPPLKAEGPKEFSATYEVSWRDTPFDRERVLVESRPHGQRVIRAQTFDPHRGQSFSLTLWAGAAGLGERMSLESEGANGRGRVMVTRAGGTLHAEGQLLSGVEASLDEALGSEVILGADHFLASQFSIAPRLSGLAPGQSLELQRAALSLGSAIAIDVERLTITRTADVELGSGETGAKASARRYEMSAGKGRVSVLLLDDAGWPLAWELPSHGATVRFRRVGP